MKEGWCLVWAALLALCAGCAGLHSAAPDEGVDPPLAAGIATADSLIASGLGRLFPGAVFLVSKDGRVIHERAFGYAQLNDYDGRRLAAPRGMRITTMFDLASVTKVMATTMAIMLLVDQGKIDVDAPVNQYLTDFRGPHLDSITVRQLLQHHQKTRLLPGLMHQIGQAIRQRIEILAKMTGEMEGFGDQGEYLLLGRCFRAIGIQEMLPKSSGLCLQFQHAKRANRLHHIGRHGF